MKKFPPLRAETIEAIEAAWHLLDDPDATAWRHGPAVDYRVSALVRDVRFSRYSRAPSAVEAFQRVCVAAGQCCDQSFFAQVARCVEIENRPHQFDRETFTDRQVTRAYEAAQDEMRAKRANKAGRLVLSSPVPSAAAVARELERITRKTATAADARDACARQSISLPLQRHGKRGRPKKTGPK